MAIRNNGKPHNYNHNMTRWAKYNARRCSGYMSMGVVPTTVNDSEYEKAKKRIDRQARQLDKKRLKINQPIF